MRTIRTVAEMRAWLGNVRAEGRSVGLVPTMGAFHAGHHSLMRTAREEQDSVVVSLFVNPAQFNDSHDLAAYPRTEANDAAEAADLGVDVLFAPPVSEIYPDGFATTVQVTGLSEVFEGAERGPGHFAGVCTVVNKLFNIVGPDVAYFGQKDAQQVAVLRRMVEDLDANIHVEVGHQLADDQRLLRVLLAEVGDVRTHHVEQLRHHRRDAVEVRGAPLGGLECLREWSRDLDGCGKAGWVDLVEAGGEQDRGAGRARQLSVARFVARIGAQIGGVVELDRVDEDRDDDLAAVLRRALDQAEVAVM